MTAERLREIIKAHRKVKEELDKRLKELKEKEMEEKIKGGE